MKGKTILIAEDYSLIFTYLKLLLGKLGYNLIHAENGQQAVETVTNNTTIDIILMDVEMPVMNGLEATVQIREINNTIPIIALTGHEMDEYVQNVLNAGCNEYLSKPIDEKVLFNILDKYVSKS